ncbi:hypothetical protein SLEP1_g40931 [Rubroshorea leprosula]|uniref:FHA domain-containing protein n=1 Tax=Rubroshorea leprosula TaxID=152421 RepID=A0AAV5L544_9ROSI|nr:hypothetical protein SLEP1_g40931 [Rubroshorea leprosula]
MHCPAMAETKERKIPVFTVLKNGAILKNIFIVNKPPADPSQTSSSEPNALSTAENPEEEKQELEDILFVGRHPDCNIMLTHPSISRFHLQINSRPSSQKLSVVDLSSVHGTWVSEKKIESGVPVEMKEGDTIRVGGSTRVYRLQWIPLSRAYETENLFISAKDLNTTEEKEEENSLQEKNAMSIEDECVKDRDPLLVEEITEACKSSLSDKNEEIQLLDVITEGVASLFSDENSGLVVKREIPSAPPVPENLNFPICDEEDAGLSTTSDTTNDQLDTLNQSFQHDSVVELISGGENTWRSLGSSEQKTNLLVNFDTSSSVLEEKVHSAAEILEGTENQKLEKKDHQEMDIPGPSPEPLMTESVNSFLPEVVTDTNFEQVNKENQASKVLLTLQPPLERGKTANAEADQVVTLLVDTDQHGDNSVTEIIENTERECMSEKECECESESFYSVPLPTESVNSSLPGEVCCEYADNKKSQTPESLLAPVLLSEHEKLDSSSPRSERRSNLNNLWSRRGKPTSALQIRTCGSTVKAVAAVNDAGKKLIPRSLLLGSEDVEEEIFTPDKENFTPNTLLWKSLKRNGKLEENKDYSNTCASSPNITSSPVVKPDEDLIASSDKENQTPKVLKEQKLTRSSSKNLVNLEKDRVVTKRKIDRAPLLSLLVNSAGKNISEASVPITTIGSNISVGSKTIEKRITRSASNNSVGRRRDTWTMVVDVTSLMDKESRKALQLLQGLKGTRLIIPRMVIRELDSLNRRGSLFRRKTEAASVLEWIEDCMVKTKWWIHVQSSAEEGQQILPTPPASPQFQFNESSDCILSETTSAITSLAEIASPTAEDHVLDSALRFRTMEIDGQLILLSNEVTMKIKAMAEGLLCETAQEFRESLVNPFSDRFLWADSSPRGQTWSYLDDVVLRERYCGGPLKKSSKGESAKGLKLILLHNSNYGQSSSIR